VYPVHHLPIIKAYADQLGLVSLINHYVPTEMNVDAGTVVLGLVLDTLRGYPETGVGKTVDLLDSWRTSYQHRSARPWFIEYCRERTILPI
jgi:hypothetical protein